MKKAFFLILNSAFLILNYSVAQPSIQWQKCLGGTVDDYVYSIQQTADGGYIAAGYTNSNDGDVSGNHGLHDFWVVKLDSSGNLQWQKCLGGTSDETANSIRQASDGGYIVAGTTPSNDGDVSGNHGAIDCWIVKLDTGGNLQWQKCLGGTNAERAYTIQVTSDGGYILGGNTYSNGGDVSGNHGGGDCWVVKLDGNANVQWQKCIGGSAGDEAHSIIQTFDGGYILAGTSTSNDGDVSGNHGLTDYLVVKLDSVGSIQWLKCLGGAFDDYANSIQQTSDNGYIVAGSSISEDGDVNGNHGSTDYWIVKLDGLGAILWQKCLGGITSDEAYSIQQTADGEYVIAGRALSNNGNVSGNHGSWDYWLVKIVNEGSIVWQKCFGGTVADLATSSQQTTDGGHVMAGYTLSNNGDVSGNHGNFDCWIVKLAADDVGIEEKNNFNALDIFPNPFTEKATLKFNRQMVAGTVQLFNMYGQMVFEKNNIYGNETIINAENLGSGVYVIEVIEKEKRIYSLKAMVMN